VLALLNLLFHLSISFSLSEIRFCLSDGQAWIFFILKSANGMLTYYESAIFHLRRAGVKDSDLPLREIIQLICEWVRPFIGACIFLLTTFINS
jgi:hypothetical protein